MWLLFNITSRWALNSIHCLVFFTLSSLLRQRSHSFGHSFLLVNFISCSRDDWKTNKTFGFHFSFFSSPIFLRFDLLRFIDDQIFKGDIHPCKKNWIEILGNCVRIMYTKQTNCGFPSTRYDQPSWLTTNFSVSFMDQLKHSKKKGETISNTLILIGSSTVCVFSALNAVPCSAALYHFERFHTYYTYKCHLKLRLWPTASIT